MFYKKKSRFRQLGEMCEDLPEKWNGDNRIFLKQNYLQNRPWTRGKILHTHSHVPRSNL